MRGTVGTLMQLTGLVVLPVAVWYGLQGGDIYREIWLGMLGVGLILVGRGLRGGGARA